MRTEVTFFPLGSWKRRAGSHTRGSTNWYGRAPSLLDVTAASVGDARIGAFEHAVGVWELRVFTPSGGPDFVAYPAAGNVYPGLILRRLMED